MDSQRLSRLYSEMLRIRMAEEKIAELYPEQEMRCPVHLCIGQEAVAVGVSANLTAADYVLSGHRSHGHYLAKGGDMKAMFAELYGKTTGCSKGVGGSMHMVDLAAGFIGATSIVASTIPISVGAALGAEMQGGGRVSAVFFGDAATEEGVFHESLNFAALKKLPVIFVCENNLFSVYSPLSVRQPEGREIGRLAEGHGIKSYKGDGNDVLAVYDIAKKAIESARRGEGPVFLEFMTYRWREHCGPNYDNDLGYRSELEFQQWRDRCPIENLRDRLLKEGIATEEQIQKINRQVQDEVEAAVAFAKESAFPPSEHLMANLFAPATDGSQL